MEEKKPILEAKNISVEFNGVSVLKDISFEVRDGDMLAVIGPNGAGKSVLLKTIVGLVQPTDGTITIRPGSEIGYLPQRFHVDYYLPMTVREFLNLKPHPKYSVTGALELVGVTERAWQEKNLGLLSSGQLQRVLLAWAIMRKPKLLLVDEPTENVDVAGQESIYHLLGHLKEKLGTAVVIVSHDIAAISHHATSMLCINTTRICYGLPERVITKKTITELYGARAFLHGHHQHHHLH